MTEKPMTVAEVANFLRRSIKSVKRLPIPFSRVGKGRLYCCVLLAMPVGNRLLFCLFQNVEKIILSRNTSRRLHARRFFQRLCATGQT